MPPIMIYLAVVLFVASTAVDCSVQSSSASSGATSSSDGTGQTFTQTSNNGQGQGTFTSNVNPGGLGTGTTGFGNNGFPNNGFPNNGFPNNNFPNNGFPNNGFPNNAFGGNFGGNPGYYGPATFNPANFGTYGPGFNYAPFPNSVPQFPQTSPIGIQAPFPPQQVLTPQEFNQALSQYLNSLQQQYAVNGGTFAHSTPGATAYATSYLGPNNLYKRQQEYINAWRDAQSQAYYGGGGSGPNYAYATGSYGPNGIHQTAGVHPPNKNKPNVDTRFDAEDKPQKKPGFFGISTSSFSSSSNVDGVEKHKQGGITTVNDNGKVTTYGVDS